MQSLGEFLGTVDPRPEPEVPRDEYSSLIDLTGKEFCQRVLDTPEFRQYIMNGIVLGDLPPGIIMRMMDHAWGKPPEKVEHTGKDGAPIVTEVRRVIVKVNAEQSEPSEAATVH